MRPHLAAPNVNHLWAALLVEELVRQGTTLFVVCPGSRSTPLAVAVARNPHAEALVHWDERAAGFVALGWGRATGRPAAVVTTSGTAVANLLPAAIEADADGVPLLLLTADRPPELRETGANQTIRQSPIFQDVTRWSLDWPVPTTDVPARWVLSTAAHAAQRTQNPPGPVHLNLPFREPLGFQPDGLDLEDALTGLESWLEGNAPFSTSRALNRHPDHIDSDELDADLVSRISTATKGLVVVGDLGGDLEAASGAVRLAEGLGWPLLPDLRSGLRLREEASIVSNVDLALTSSHLRERTPDVVLHLGGRIVSKRLSQFLASSRPTTYARLAPAPSRVDPDTLVTDHLLVPVAQAAAALEGAGRSTSSQWRDLWSSSSRAVTDTLSGLEDVSEPAIACAVSTAGLPIVVAASMPIRDLEAFGQAGEGVEVFANRGASGIDGTVATAHGVARGLDAPVLLLIGDLALLHDQTSLALLRSGPPVIVVVINNDGGGIFHRLPIASGAGALEADTFERFFSTPHGLGFRDAARQVGLAFHAPTTLDAFQADLEAAVESGASALIEVRTNRDEQASLRRRLEAEVAAAVDAVLEDA